MDQETERLKQEILKYPNLLEEWETIFGELIGFRVKAEFPKWKRNLKNDSMTLEDLLGHIIPPILSRFNLQEGRRKIAHAILKCPHKICHDKILGIRTSSLHPLQFGVPKYNEPFLGQGDGLSKLQLLYDPQFPEFVIVCGLEGMGKSRLVSQFLQLQLSPGIIWLDGKTPSSLSNGCISLGIHVQTEYKITLPFLTHKDFHPFEALIKICDRIYEKLEQKVILVLDNCNEDIHKQPMLASFFEQCCTFVMVIIISRSQLANFPHPATRIPVKAMSSNESLTYLKTLLKCTDDDTPETCLKQLCSKLYHYPIALKYAASHIQNKKLTTLYSTSEIVTKYLRKARITTGKKAKCLRRVGNETHSEEDYKKCFSDILTTTVGEIKCNSGEDAPYACALLQILIYVKHSDLPVDLLKDIFSSGRKKFELKKFENSLVLLRKFLLLEVNQRNEEKAIEMNPVAQKSLKEKCDPHRKGLKKIRKYLIRLETRIDDLRSLEVRHIVELFIQVIRKENMGQKLLTIAIKMLHRLQALVMVHEILEFSEALHAANCNTDLAKDPNALKMSGIYAVSLCESGRCEEALEVSDYVYRVECEVYGETSKICLDTLHMKGGIHRYLEQFQHAIKCYQQVLTVRSRLYPEGVRKIVTAKANIAQVYTKLCQFKEAVEIFSEVIPIQEKLHFTNELLQSHRSLGYCYYKQKSYFKARDHLAEATKINDPQNKVVAQFNLGRTLIELREFRQGIELLKTVETKQVVWYGENHHDTKKTREIIEKYTPNQGEMRHIQDATDSNINLYECSRDCDINLDGNGHKIMDTTRSTYTRRNFDEHSNRAIQKFLQKELHLMEQLCSNRKRKYEELACLYRKRRKNQNCDDSYL